LYNPGIEYDGEDILVPEDVIENENSMLLRAFRTISGVVLPAVDETMSVVNKIVGNFRSIRGEKNEADKDNDES
jgi:hypothetical protein